MLFKIVTKIFPSNNFVIKNEINFEITDNLKINDSENTANKPSRDTVKATVGEILKSLNNSLLS